MLRRVFECTRPVVWRFVLSFCVIFWICVGALVASCVPSTARAEVAVSGAVGLDVWQVPTTQVRYLPNYSTPEAWKAANTWGAIKAKTSMDTDIGPLTFTAAAQASVVGGHRVDRLDVDLRVTEAVGFRVGMLPYRVSWCRGYDGSSPWLSEPDAFCRFSGLNEVSQGGFGGQAYHSGLAGGWLVESMAAIYRPMVDGQDTKLGPYVAVGPTVRHEKHGASVNALHLGTGIQARAGWLHTIQHQDSKTGSYQRQIDYNTLYLAGEGHVAAMLDVRASLSAYVGNQLNAALPFSWDGRSTTIELIGKPAPGHSIALGLSNYTNVTTYAKAPNFQRVEVATTSLAWRTDWHRGLHTVLQATRSTDDATTRAGLNTIRAGNAVGFRVAKTF